METERLDNMVIDFPVSKGTYDDPVSEVSTNDISPVAAEGISHDIPEDPKAVDKISMSRISLSLEVFIPDDLIVNT